MLVIRCSVVFIVDFEHAQYIILVFASSNFKQVLTSGKYQCRKPTSLIFIKPYQKHYCPLTLV